MSERPVIGFIGLGAIGGPIAEAIADGGYELVVHDTAPSAVEAMVGRGALACASPVEVANLADIVFVSLPRPEVVLAVALGDDGLAAGARMRTYVDLSTTGATVATEVAEALGARGLDVLDAPVSGGVAGARARTLAVMASGDEAVFERVRPLLQLFGKNVFHVGSKPGQGQTAKLLNNLLSATALAITSEAVTYGITAGLDPATLLEVFNAGTGRNTATATKFPEHVLTQRFASEFRLELMAKDLELCLGEAHAREFPMQVGELVQQLWTRAAAQADAGADHTEIIKFFEALSGVEVSGGGGRRRMSYEIHAVRYATLHTHRSELFYRHSSYGEPDTEIDMAYYFWVLRRGDEVILVDTGFDPEAGRRRGRTCLVPPVEAVGRLGIESAAVSTIVVTHFHYDHIGNLDAFPQAQLIVPKTELEFWTGPMADAPPVRLARRAGRDRLRRAGPSRRARANHLRNRGDPRRDHRDRGRRPLSRTAAHGGRGRGRKASCSRPMPFTSTRSSSSNDPSR